LSAYQPGYALTHLWPAGIGHGDQNQTLPEQLLTALVPGSIQGMVTDQSTGKPISGATVTVMNVPFTNVTLTTTTDIYGNYSFSAVPATPPASAAGAITSSYVVTASAPGYSSVIQGNATGSISPTPITVGTQAALTINFQLPMVGGSIAGTVVTTAQVAVPSAVVTATLIGTPGTTTSGKSVIVIADTTGSYLFANLPPGNYSLTAATSASGTAGPVVTKTVTSGSALTGVTLIAGSGTTTATGHDSISGVVQYAVGVTVQPVVGATVQLYDQTGLTLLFTTTTNASGNYSFTNLADGTYEVKAAAGAQSQSPTQSVTVTSTVNAGAATGVNFSVSPLFTFPMGLSMVSVPFSYSAGAGDSAAILGLAPLSTGQIPIAAYNPSSNSYLLYPNLPGADGKQTVPGRAYWIKEASPQVFISAGTVVSSPFQETLSAGWNMIGNPFTTAIDWNLLQIEAPIAIGSVPANTFMSMQAALTSGLIQAPLWTYSQAQGQYIGATTLQAFGGYWIYVNPQMSQNQSLTIQFVNPLI
jgi:hypothetical protein